MVRTAGYHVPLDTSAVSAYTRPMADFFTTGLCLAQLALPTAQPVMGACGIYDMPGSQWENRFRVEINAPFEIDPGDYAVRVTSRSAPPAHWEIDIEGRGSIILAPSRPLADTVNALTSQDRQEVRWQRVTTAFNGLRTVILIEEPRPTAPRTKSR